jgi:hypothetical protein
MRKDTRGIIALVLFLAIDAFLLASTAVPMNLRDLSTRAHRVAVGRVERVSSYRDAATGRIYSRVELADTQTVAGERAPASFEIVGGEVGGIREWIAGFPFLREGDRLVLFLAEDTRTPFGPTVGLWQGVFFVEKDAKGLDTVVNHNRQPVIGVNGANLVVAGPGRGAAQADPSARVTLEDFLNQVRSLRQPPRASGTR